MNTKKIILLTCILYSTREQVLSINFEQAPTNTHYTALDTKVIDQHIFTQKGISTSRAQIEKETQARLAQKAQERAENVVKINDPNPETSHVSMEDSLEIIQPKIPTLEIKPVDPKQIIPQGVNFEVDNIESHISNPLNTWTSTMNDYIDPIKKRYNYIPDEIIPTLIVDAINKNPGTGYVDIKHTQSGSINLWSALSGRTKYTPHSPIKMIDTIDNDLEFLNNLFAPQIKKEPKSLFASWYSMLSKKPSDTTMSSITNVPTLSETTKSIPISTLSESVTSYIQELQKPVKPQASWFGMRTYTPQRFSHVPAQLLEKYAQMVIDYQQEKHEPGINPGSVANFDPSRVMNDRYSSDYSQKLENIQILYKIMKNIETTNKSNPAFALVK